MMKNEEIAKKMLELLGGKENIRAHGNCYTRVRVTVSDLSKVDPEGIKKQESTLGVVTEGNQIQIVVGPGKSVKIAQELSYLTGLKNEVYADESDAQARKEANKAKNNTPFKRLLKRIANIFVPIIPAFVGCGLMVAIYEAACVFCPGFSDTAFGHILSAIAYSVFNVLPVIVGYNAVKEFGGDAILGAILAAVLTSSSITGVNLLGIEFLAGRGGVFSVLIVSILAAHFEKWIRKFVPDMLDTFLTPLITIFVMSFAGLLIFQPIGGFISETIGSGVSYVIENVPALAGLATLVYLPLVLSGMHHGLIAVNAALIAEYGVTYLLPVTCMAGAGQVGAAFYVFLKTKNKKLKRICLNGLPVGMLGIGEPLMWGVTVPLGKPFIASCLGGAVGGSAVAMMKVAALIPELSGLQLALITNAPIKYLIGIAISYAAGFVFCMLLGFDDPEE